MCAYVWSACIYYVVNGNVYAYNNNIIVELEYIENLRQ